MHEAIILVDSKSIVLRKNFHIIIMHFYFSILSKIYILQIVKRALIQKLCNILDFQGSFIGQCIYSADSIKRKQLGCSAPLFGIPTGSFIHNIELAPFLGARYCRAAGTYAKLVRLFNNKAFVRLPSGVEFWISDQCLATLGICKSFSRRFFLYSTAGTFRRLGWRPRTRGVAMNPVDHPHGGGEGKSSGGRPSVSRWGWLTKNNKQTRSRFKPALKFKRTKRKKK